jgi:hypothetical protein
MIVLCNDSSAGTIVLQIAAATRMPPYHISLWPACRDYSHALLLSGMFPQEKRIYNFKSNTISLLLLLLMFAFVVVILVVVVVVVTVVVPNELPQLLNFSPTPESICRLMWENPIQQDEAWVRIAGLWRGYS